MSDQALVFTFDGNTSAMSEAMVQAGRALRLGVWRKGLTVALMMVCLVFIIIGGAVVGYLVGLFGGVPLGFLSVPAAIGGAFAGVLAHRLNDQLIRLMAKGVMDTAFNQGPQEMRFDERGVTLRNDRAHWHTAWAGVHDIRLGEEGLCVFVSGIALYVPRDALPSDRAATLARIEAWRRGAEPS